MSAPNHRFWAKVVKGAGKNSCWLWLGCKLSKGYGQLTVNGNKHLAHRFSWELFFGPIPAELFVLHHCDVPACVNPAHLWLGTNADNMRDRNAKGRQASGKRSGAYTHPERVLRGERHPRAKLTKAQVVAIRRATGLHREIATRFGISRTQVCQIRRHLYWR